MKRVERLRWRIAALIDRLPGQCWSGLADWPLGYRRWPWAPISDGCREDVARCGGCYCGKLRGLPVNPGPARCGDCWTPPGREHALSCPAVSPAQMRRDGGEPR